jgi:hypothetical protein
MSLKAEIVSRYGSVYKFWKAHAEALPSKGVVYQVASGNYAGDQAGQERRMRAIMDGKQNPQADVDVDRIYAAIRDVACARCPDRQAPGPRCAGCLELFRLQALAVSEVIGQ